MKLYTHSEIPRKKTPKIVKFLLFICTIFASAMFIGLSLILIINKNIFEGILILSIFSVLITVCIFCFTDMVKAYVELLDDKIIVVDYYFGIKKIKCFSKDQIFSYKIVQSYSMEIRGYRLYTLLGQYIPYIVFKDKNDKYLFKIICLEQTKEAFKELMTKQTQ